MVSKVAVIALVVIVASPILLGYGFNLHEVTETNYRTSNDSVNVTSLLKTGTSYSFAQGSVYTNNTDFGIGTYTMRAMPIFNSITTTKTPLTMIQNHYASGTAFSLRMYFQDYSDIFTYVLAEYGSGAGQLQMKIDDDNGVTKLTVDYLHSAYYGQESGTVIYTYYAGGNLNDLQEGSYTIANTHYFLGLDKVGGDGTDVYLDLSRSVSTKYVDLNKGYYFQSRDNNWYIKYPSNTHSVVISVDLDSITDSAYSFKMGYQGIEWRFDKTTTAGVVSWKAVCLNSGWQQDLYYDNDSSNNSYQFYFDFDMISTDSTYRYYRSNAEFRYVGAWPAQIGLANYYFTASHTVNLSNPITDPEYNLSYTLLHETTNNRTPTVRVDVTEFRAFEYQVISNKEYIPTSFKTNPATTIKGVDMYGTSITFGGNTYTVDKGNITLGSRSVSVDGLVLSSIPNPNGGYDNKIGNTVVSTTWTPSTIRFDGDWSASISTDSMESYTYTKTEWTAGKFAWQGTDSNFLMAGLLTAIGAFIALGVYARRTRASVWPLMIVCGGAAFLFLLMM